MPVRPRTLHDRRARPIELKGLAYERIDFTYDEHAAKMDRSTARATTTVPGLLIDGEPVHGSRAILARLEELEPEPALYPEPIADAVREAERWGDEELQDLGRRLPWGALHFRPEAMGTFARRPRRSTRPARTSRSSSCRASWRYHGITAVRLAEDLAGLPAKLDHIERSRPTA